MTKLQLELKYNTAILWFQEFEIYHMFKFSLNRELITFETILEDSKSGVKGLMSLLYKLLNSRNWSLPISFQNNWQKDCKSPLSKLFGVKFGSLMHLQEEPLILSFSFTS